MSDKWIILIAVFVIAVMVGIIIWRKRRKNRKMEHIVYIHINNDKILPNLGLAFDPQFEVKASMLSLKDYEFHRTCFRLRIARANRQINGFYGNHISSLTAIVGNNGAGKTSALRFLLKAVLSGSAHEISGFVLTETGNHSLCVYHSDDVRVETDAPGINVQNKNNWPEIETFIYGGHVNILSSAEDIITTELQGLVNATEGYLLSADLMHYGRELSTNGHFSWRDYATAYNYQNQWRVCNFLSQYEGPLKELLHLPEYVLVLPNTAGQWSLMHRLNEKDRVEYKSLEHAKEWSFREFRLAELIYYSMVNYISDGLGERKLWDGYINTWNKTLNDKYNGDIVALFRQYIDNQNLKEGNQYRVLLEYIHEVVSNVSIHCQFDDSSLYHYFYFRVDDDSMKTFLGWLQGNPTFIASRYFDMHYAHDIDDYTILSSGEKAMLNMYSRIYDAVISKHQRDSNYAWPTLFVFDEAEIGFHPEWQRTYVKNITLFLEEMAQKASELMKRYRPDALDFRYQIILTSHSPIILSDIPSQCAIMLRRDRNENRTVNVSNTRKQTFGTNIFELYRDSFFLEGGLVGEFAENYIRELSERIEILRQPTEDELAELEKQIAIIGDENIREYLLSQLEEYMDRQTRIAYYERKLESLRNEQN